MGLGIFVLDGDALPRPTALELRCDGLHNDPPCAQFRQAGLIAQHEAALRAGWSITSEGVLGPCCSGKKFLLSCALALAYALANEASLQNGR